MSIVVRQHDTLPFPPFGPRGAVGAVTGKNRRIALFLYSMSFLQAGLGQRVRSIMRCILV